MAKDIIKVEGLSKEFTFDVKANKGFFANLFHPDRKTIKAVDNISFTVQKGETLAFIGPNGAGKSTTIKMLTGILHPTRGKLTVAGYSPQDDRRNLAYKIGTVFGQRSQLIFNLPMADSFELFGRIYELTPKEITKRTKELISLLDIGEILNQPVRKLSLGQRMRAEVAISLIHKPEVIFLDEPTIGLDVVAKRNLREILLTLNREDKTTIFLTSHDVGDIEALCARTIVINHGKVVVDMDTESISKEYFTEKLVRLVFKNQVTELNIPEAQIISLVDGVAEIKINTKKFVLTDVIKSIMSTYELEDIDIENPPLEDIISHIYGEKQ